MSRALYTAVSGLRSHQTRMDVIGNNIANVNTYGYKTSRVTFRDVFYQNMSIGSAGGTDDGTMGGQNPSQIGYGTMVSSIDTSHGRTGFAPTGYPMDCYINGEGYFAVQDASGATKYTRVGVFGVDSEGNVVDSNGMYVCGVNTADGSDPTELTPMNINDMFDGTGPFTNINIAASGEITAIDSEGEKVTTDTVKIAIANIPNPSGMIMEGNSYYLPGPNAEGETNPIQVYYPGSGNTGMIKTGGLEMSATDISQEFSDMIVTQRGFQANSRVITVVDQMLEEVVNMKR